MAKTLTESKGMPKSLRIPEFDYSKYQNTKLISSRRKEIQAANGDRVDKVTTNPKKAFRLSDVIGGGDSSAHKHAGSVGKYESADKVKLAQFRSTKSEIKSTSRSSDIERPRAKSSQERRSHAKSPARVSPLSDVKRRLKFDNDDDINEAASKGNDIDFTDKLAALRSLMNKDRESKTIHDCRAYYDEYRSNDKKIMVSRTDSLKENDKDLNQNDKHKDHHRSNNKSGDNRIIRDRSRGVQSADIFREKERDGRLSAVDLHALKNNLLKERHKSSRNNSRDLLDGDIKLLNTGVNGTEKTANSGDALVHATDNRRILVSSRRHRAASVDKRESHREARPSSSCDAKETQTNTSFLNNSGRSVQSNVPFYEPGTPLQKARVSQVHTPVLVKARKSLDQVQGNVPDGIEKGLNLSGEDQSSPSRSGKQSNVDTFVGNSLTPEKDRRKVQNHVLCNGDSNMEGLRKSAHKNTKSEGELLAKKIKKLSQHLTQRSETNSHKIRSRFRTSSRADDLIKDEKNKRDPDIHQRERVRSKSSLDYNKDVKLDHEFARKLAEKSSKTDRKVREWIEQQKVLDKGMGKGDYIEEYNVDIVVSTKGLSKGGEITSPTHSCDKVPVKLEKPQRSRPSSAQLSKHGSNYHNQGQSHASHRSNITARLEKISAAASSEQTRLDHEFPVRDLQGRVQEEHNSTETENTKAKATKKTRSSIFSLPFSVKSGESISSTVQAVKLLRRLYKVDDTDKRQNLVLMARCFRRWFNNVLYAKSRDLQITEAAGRVSPVSYGVMLRKSDICYRTSVLGRYFAVWRAAVDGAKLQSAVHRLQRRHLLKKGMNAFKWAINRSKLQQGILQDRINGMLMATSFTKWRDRAVENRRLRLQQAFLRWRQFTKEAQRIRMLRNQTNRRLKQTILSLWCDKFQTRLKENKADRHFRVVLLSQGWLSWQCYTQMSKEKKVRQMMAMQLYESTVQRKIFVFIRVEFEKYRKAKNFQRTSQLKLALTAWRAGQQICRAEREQDVRVAAAHWSHSAVRNHFTTWRDSLLTRRAVHMSNNNITKHAYTTWHTQYQYLIQRRLAVDAFTRNKVLSRAFQHWCVFVSIMKRRRAAAVECIHAALQRQVINRWRWYTEHQRELRVCLDRHVYQVELGIQRKFLSKWRARFNDKCDLQTAQRFWSNRCARKAAIQWKLVCHRRRMKRLLVETEPLRQLVTQRVFFTRWKMRLSAIEEEKREAAEKRAVLDLSQLRLQFDKWHQATHQLLRIKPMVLRYQTRLVSQCFTDWHQYVQHKAECSNSEQQFLKYQLKNRFAAWRRQYLAHQIEKEFNKRVVLAQSRRCLQAWRSVIQRKHAAQKFRDTNLVRRAFYDWNSLAFTQLRQKKLHKVEMETVQSTLREYFGRWRERMNRHQTLAEEGCGSMQQLRDNNTLRTLFNFWRRLFRATLVARENEKIRTRRLAKQALQEWHSVTQNSMHEAVEKFAQAIGLQVGGAGDGQIDPRDVITDDWYQNREGEGDLVFEPMNFDLEGMAPVPRSASSPHTPRTPKTPITPKTPRTPRQFSSAIGTPMKRLFSPPLSRQSLVQSLDFETGAQLTSSFLDARFEMEHAVKIESKREIVVTVVNRLRHWPIGTIFDQWKEFTSHQRELKHLKTQMISIREKLVLSQYFKTWTQYHHDWKLAKQHYEQVLQHKALLGLILYRNERKQKKQMSLLADNFYAKNTYCKIFPDWRAKAMEKQHKEHIVHLWTNITEQERELIPRERSFRYQLNKKSLKHCYTTWFLAYQKIVKLKRAYHRILLKKYFSAWSTWALEKHARQVKCTQFRERRVKTMVFSVWCLRNTQRTEVERRYEDVWHNYLGVIVQSWCRWAKDQRKRALLTASVSETRHRHLVSQMFATWKSSTQKLQRVQQWYNKRLVIRSLSAWHDVAIWQKDLRQRAVQCQIMSYTVLAKRVFAQWHDMYSQRLQMHELHEQRVQRRTLHVVKVWRKKAQVTRGKLLHQHLQKQQLQRMFDKWKAAYGRQLTREDQLSVYVTSKNQALMSQCLGVWRTELMALRAERVFNAKLCATLLYNWKLAAKACRQRSLVLASYVNRKQQSQQKIHFLYWYNVAKARKSIRGHANLKIQLSVFKAWLLYTRKKNNLRRLESGLTRRKNQQIVEKHWYLLQTRYHYCVELADTAHRVITDKNRALMTQALSHWVHRLQLVIADECHKHLLAKRVASRWHQFVLRRRRERQHMTELIVMATQFYHKTLCNKVYTGWFNQVLATRHNHKRQQKLCAKYALCWKHKVDLAYTAKCVRQENLLMMVWKKWHMEFVKHRTMKKVEAFQRKQTLTMIFVSWKNLSRKKPRLSMIPLPVSPAFNMPNATSSTSSTPTEELISPVPFARPSQIPMPSGPRSKGRLMSTGSGRCTPTGGSSNGRHASMS